MPGAMLTTAPNCTSAPEERFHEDVDHRPAADPGDDVVELRTLLSRRLAPSSVVTSITAISMTASPASLSTGTVTLATNTRSASGYMREAISSTMPSMMVLGCPEPTGITVSTGETLAGM